VSVFGGDYQDDFAMLKKKVPAQEMEGYLTNWREREPNNPDAWILTANWLFEKSDALDINLGGNALAPGNYVIKSIDGEMFAFDPKTDKQIGRINVHEARHAQLARQAISMLVEAREKAPHRLDIHLGIAHALDKLEAEDERIAALKIMVAAARTYAGKLRWCHDEPLGRDEEQALVHPLHQCALSYYSKETAEDDTRFFEVVQLMVQACPNRPETWNDLAISANLKKDWTGVQKALMKACEIAPEDSIVLYNLGTNSMKLGLRAVAIKAFEKVVHLNNDPETAKAARRELQKINSPGR
jgi:tetratricopeptide (TPR) repeat protein